MSKIGRIAYRFYYQPKAFFDKTLDIGLLRSTRMAFDKKTMVSTSKYLKEVTYPDQELFFVYFLTGKKYWFQTAFCLHSLQKTSAINIHAIMIDDGSFDDNLVHQILSQFPTTATIVRTAELNKNLDEVLPAAQFPVLRNRRLVYPHLRKITDVHTLPCLKPKLVLDSDMLFFHKPSEIISWLKNPVETLFMRDVKESYGYSRRLMQSLTGIELIPDRLNVGVAGIASAGINWHTLESWTNSLMRTEGTSYLQEQALTAMLAADKQVIFLDERRYKVLPKITVGEIPEVLHHYVADSKYDYFVKGWKRCLES